MTEQKVYLLSFLTGLVVFLGSFGKFLISHQGPLNTMEAYGHIILISSSALGAMVAALKYQLPRNPGDYADRVSDSKLSSINKESAK